MKISKELIKPLEPCTDGYEWYLKHGTEDLLETLLLVNVENDSWARWLFTKLMTVKQRRMIAVFAAEQVLHLFEVKYPEDLRPRKAIEAAKAVIQNDSEENRASSYAAYAASYAAASYAAASYAAYAAYDAASAAYASAAYASYAASSYAAYAAYDAASAAAAAYASDAASDAARKEMQERIIKEAVRILDNA